MTTIKKLLGGAFSLKDDTASQDEIYERLVKGATIKGTNMCVLIFAILIASIGLNMNSTAVIIGAMLISPLMGSIIAIAYGLASGDLTIAERYAVGFVVQIIICLLTATIYFSITPISGSTSELLARTSPTIWDVLIAICGGAAGTIGQTRKEKSNNIIPGVAIATALMPPICTAGYGLATHQWTYFFGAIYLFTLNVYFIGLSAVAILLILKVPRHSYIEVTKKKRVIRTVILTSIIISLPSVFFAVRFVKEKNVTGFEDPEIIRLQEIGDEARILFPQIRTITEVDAYEYEDGEAKDIKRLEVKTSGNVDAVTEDIIRKWLAHERPEYEEILIMQEN